MGRLPPGARALIWRAAGAASTGTMKQQLLSLSRRPAMQQGLLLIAATTLAYGLDYLFNLVAGRLLEPAEFGIYIALAGVAQVLVVASVVVRTVVTRYVAQYQARPDAREHQRAFGRAALAWTWRWGLGATAAAALLSWPLARFLRLPQVAPALALAAAVLLLALRPVTDGLLQGQGRFGQLGLVQFIQAGLRLLLGAGLMLLGLGAFGALAALPLASLVALAYGLWILGLLRRKAQTATVTLPGLLRYSTFTAAGLLGFALLVNMDAILVKRFFEPVPAGQYGAAVTLAKVIQFFPLAIIMILFPVAARRRAAQRDPAVVLLPALALVGGLCGGIALLYFLYPGRIIEIVFRDAYRLDGPVLGLLGLAMALLSLANVWLNYFLSIERTRYVYLVGLGVVLQLGLMMAFHRALWQLPAAMIANGAWLLVAGIWLFWRDRRV